jgi:hypothetical protein
MKENIKGFCRGIYFAFIRRRLITEGIQADFQKMPMSLPEKRNLSSELIGKRFATL